MEISNEDGESLGIFKPEQSFYPAFSLRPARAAIRSTPLEDVYIIPNDFFPDGSVGFRISGEPSCHVDVGSRTCDGPRHPHSSVAGKARKPGPGACSDAVHKPGIRVGIRVRKTVSWS